MCTVSSTEIMNIRIKIKCGKRFQFRLAENEKHLGRFSGLEFRRKVLYRDTDSGLISIWVREC